LVNVSFNNPEAESNYSINILNINGQTVFTQNGLLNQGVNSIPITHNLPGGIYFLQIIPTNAKNQLYTRTFVVTNT
ncbi:MAG: T9SS type A sorting domain-containing protein, partial [Bacteroidota bacterium]